MTTYIVKYHDNKHTEKQFQTEAIDCYDAKKNAINSNLYIRQHPNSIFSISAS